MKQKIILSLIVLLIVLVSIVYAADVKWSALAELTTIADADILCVVDSGTSKKITVLNFFDTIDTFPELNTIVADKTLVNEEDAAAWDALGTFNLGITITTGDPFTLGANRIDNGSDLLDGEQIAADTIDDDSIDFADVTGVDLTLTDCGAITSTGTITATVGFDIVGAADIDYGSADVIDHTFVSDGTGDAEIVLPNDSIGDNEIDWSGLTTSADFTVTGTLIASVGIDGVGAVDMDYGSVDITDHTFVTDGTGTAEIVLPAGSIDGTEILDDTIDSGDYAAGSIDAEHLAADIIDETKIADNGIDSEHYNDGSIDLVHLAAGVYAKDLVTTSPITGAADNIFVGADSDVTIAITLLKDVVATSPILIDGGTNVDDILPGADADLTISVTVAKDIVTTAPLTGAVDNIIIGTDADITLGIDVLKDLVTTAPVTGGTNDIFPGADADITVALDFTAAWDFSGATVTMPKRTKNDDRFYTFNLFNPNLIYDEDTQICFEPNLPAAITITEVTISCDADPTTELDIDLKWADAFIGLANAALIEPIDTTSGTTDIDSGFDDATVAAGKCLYIEFGADPDSNITQAIVKIRYDYD